ncbi:M81 family metallopeptidase [Novosphingobium sp. P6W]|uniref:M81 family metallopeptidase n=1 Tax=Novosphingobium sp. P6W TaxID=1609758 RepID=UPI0005C2A3AF|nr:M81 family metallopeptidase [Novosphingobium sp. P6W]AXB78886.1 microcystin LR degradation protein MlrC-like protein [Novosphingobium sp. P6W]KIS29573.1 microcystin LR degradation protein MlrC-like protein [Novosphingobium sp. P6W]
MRVSISQLVMETNTFAPIPLGLSAYEEMGIHHGDASAVAPEGVFATLALWRRLAESAGHEVIEGLAAQGQPGGRTLQNVYESFRDEILENIRAALPLDIILLNLHGAMSAGGHDDCEGDLLEQIRALVGPDVVIGVEVDLHCHTTTAMLRCSDILIAYKEYPHTDIAECAKEVFQLSIGTAEKRVKPVISVVDCKMVGLWHTTREPMVGFVDAMRAHEAAGDALSVSLGHGFPWGDVAEGGARLWVITDDQRERGDRLALELAQRFFDIRNETAPPLMAIDEALDHAIESGALPVVASDGADNPGGGAPSDSTFVLERILAKGVDNALIAFLHDPEAVRMLVDAGIGAKINLRIGGKTGPSSGNPVDLEIEVKAVLHNHFQSGLGLVWPLGTAVWVRAANQLDIVLTSVRSQPFDPSSLEKLGIDLAGKRLIVVKSTQHFHAGFAPLAKGGVIYIAAPGALTPDFANIPYTKKSLDYWPRSDAASPCLFSDWRNEA